MRDFEGNCTIAGEKIFLLRNMASSNSKVYYSTALKFSAKENNFIMKKRVFMICEITIINADFRISENASHFKKTLKQIKSKPKFCFENSGHTFAEIAMILTCAKIQRKVLMFGEVGASERSFCS